MRFSESVHLAREKTLCRFRAGHGLVRLRYCESKHPPRDHCHDGSEDETKIGGEVVYLSGYQRETIGHSLSFAAISFFPDESCHGAGW